MTYTPRKLLSFEEFIAQYGDDTRNWQDDYARKVEEYAFLNIPEYWIVDFRGLGCLQFIGNSKEPTFTVCQLVDGIYQQQQYRLGNLISSYLFPNLQLRLDDVMPT